MSESTDAAAGGRRGGRTVSKSTPDEVMELACGLPLTWIGYNVLDSPMRDE